MKVMSNREQIISLLDVVPEYKLGYILAYVQGIAAEGAEVPNAETAKAIEDARNGIGMSRRFSSVAELMEDLNADD